MSTITRVSHQWMSRPDDERFTSLTDLHLHTTTVRRQSGGKVVSSRSIRAEADDTDHQALTVYGPNGGAVTPTHWSFGQLAERSGAPAGYLRTIPAALAADCINYGLGFTRDIEDVGVLVRHADDGVTTLQAITGPAYGRVWNSTISGALMDRFGDGRTGDFRVPGVFGKPVEVTKRNTTLYASDRDMFVFLADEERRITVHNRRGGKDGSLARGFMVWNSEVGSTSFGIATFLFDYVCSNRIVWGATEYREIRGHHTASAPDKWIAEMVPAIEAYAQSSTGTVQEAIAAAQARKVEDLDKFLKNRSFTKRQIGAFEAAFKADEERPMETVFDVVTGITAYARGVQFQDQRVALEREAGKILDMVA